MIADILGVLLGFACLLVFVAVVGHGMWVAAAKVMEFLSGPAQQPGPPQNCTSCGSFASVLAGRCRICGYQPRTDHAALPNKADPGEVVRYTRRLLARGLIDQATCDTLLAAIEREQMGVRYKASVEAGDEGLGAGQGQGLATVSVPTPANSTPEPEIINAEIVFDPPARTVAPTPPPPVSISPFAPKPPPSLPGPPPPARSLADMLQGFLEESNIRWGEVLAGLFIVVSSVGLVVSLRNTLKQIPYFPALLFLTFTLAFHGAGLYSLRKWNLRTVSRAVLIISLLLVPLCFGAAIVLSGPSTEGQPPWHPLFLLATSAGLVGGAWVAWSSAQEVASRSASTLTAAVLGTSACQVLIHRAVTQDTGNGWLILLAIIPTLFFLATALDQVWQVWQVPRLSWRRAQPLLLAAGVGLFALLMPLTLLISQASSVRDALAVLSPVLCLPAAAVLAIGSFLHVRTQARSLAQLKTAGTAIAIVSGLLLVLCLIAAWPRPGLLIAVGLVNAACLIALAHFAKLPPFAAAGAACLALTAVIGLHWWQGRLESDEFSPGVQLLRAVVSGRSAVLLAIIGAAFAGLGGWLTRNRNKAEGPIWFANAAGLAIACLLLALYIGFAPNVPEIADPALATPLLLGFAVALLAVGRCVPHQALAYAGSAGLWAGLVHALWRCEPVREWLSSRHLLPERPVVTATLLFATLAALLALETALPKFWAIGSAYIDWKKSKPFCNWLMPLSIVSLIASLIVLPWLIWLKPEQLALQAASWTAVGIVWLVLAYTHREPAGLTAFEVAITFAVAHTVAWLNFSGAGGEPWFWTGAHLAQQLAAVAGCAIAWRLLRRTSANLPVTHHLANPIWPSVDQFLLPLAACGVLALGGAAVFPGVMEELSYVERIRIPTDPIDPGQPLIGQPNVVLPVVTPGVYPLKISPAHWWACVIVLLAAVVAAWDCWRIENAVWLLMASVVPFILPATYSGEQTSVGSMLRWLLAGHVLVATAAVVLRDKLANFWRNLPGSDMRPFAKGDAVGLQLLALGLGGLPILVITIAAVTQGVNRVALAGPLQTTWLGSLGMTLNYGLPLLALVAGCLALAIREEQSAYAFGGFVLFQGAANLALLLALSHLPTVTATIAGALGLQWNLIAAAIFGLLWRGLAKWIEPSVDLSAPRRWHEALRRPRLANGPVVLSVILVRVLAFWCVAQVFLSPHYLARGEEQLGFVVSYVGWALTLALMALRTRPTASGWFDSGMLATAALIGILSATIDGLDTARRWHAFHMLEFAWLALIAAAAGRLWSAFTVRVPQSDRAEPPSTFIPRLVWGVICVATVLVLFAVRGADADPWQPWWPLGLTLAAGLGCAAIAWHRRRQRLAWFSAAPLFVLAGLALYLFHQFFVAEIAPLLAGLSLAACSAASLWLAAELYYERREQRPFDPEFRGLAAHRGLTLAMLPVVGLAVGVYSFGILVFPSLLKEVWFPAVAIVSTLLLLGRSLWDRGAHYVFPGLFVSGALTILLICAAACSRPTLANGSQFFLALTLAYAIYVTALSHLFQRGPTLVVQGDSWRIPEPLAGLMRLNRWLPGLNAALALALSAIAFFEVLTFSSRGERIAASFVPAIVGWGVSALAQQRRRMLMQQLALVLGAGSLVLIGWADLDPSHTADAWLDRTIRLLLALGLVAFLYSLAVPRWLFSEGDWPAAFRRAGAIAGALAVAALVAVLSLEFALYDPVNGAPVSGPQVLIVSLVLCGLIAGLLAIALAPERDPLGLSEAGRMGYVYAAQVVLVLLFVHLHLARPAWFEALRPYWPYLLLTVAFAWSALGEVFRRAGRPVLAEPLTRTGAMLPLLPIAGYWLVGSSADYAAVLFVVAILYGLLAQQRQSALAGIAAAIAGNAALWVIWSRQDLMAFAHHPQLWLIPPAISAIVAAQINRQKLDSASLTGIRYVALIIIYLSSTSELFLRGAGESLWPPVILASVAVAGAAAGVMLRIRAFLYLGSGFALIALVSMVWHAARAIEHVWPWWAFGIGMGIAILVLFGVFEKRRADMMQLVERLRQWEQ